MLIKEQRKRDGFLLLFFLSFFLVSLLTAASILELLFSFLKQY